MAAPFVLRLPPLWPLPVSGLLLAWPLWFLCHPDWLPASPPRAATCLVVCLSGTLTAVMAVCSCLSLNSCGPLPCICWPSSRNVCRHHSLQPRCCRLPFAAVLDLLPEDGHLQVVLLFCMVFTLLTEGPSLRPPLLSWLVAVLHLMLRIPTLPCKLLQHHSVQQYPDVPLSCCESACAAAKVKEVHSCAAQTLCRQVGGAHAMVDRLVL